MKKRPLILFVILWFFSAVGMSPGDAVAQTYNRVYIQGGTTSFATNPEEASLNGLDIPRTEEPPNFMGSGPSIRAGVSFETSRTTALHLELEFQQLVPQTSGETARLLRPDSGDEVQRVTVQGSGKISSLLLQFGVQYAPERIRIGIVQPYLLLSAGTQFSRLADYRLDVRYRDSDQPQLFNTRTVRYDYENDWAWGLNGNVGVGVDIRLFPRYSLFFECRGNGYNNPYGVRSYLTPQAGISIAFETSPYGRSSL